MGLRYSLPGFRTDELPVLIALHAHWMGLTFFSFAEAVDSGMACGCPGPARTRLLSKPRSLAELSFDRGHIFTKEIRRLRRRLIIPALSI